jgi:serine phosphatase RsbU (regulator of sigma subunit)
MAKLIPGEIATMCLLSIEMSTGRARLANAGHPPPLLSCASGVHLLTERSPLLGIPVRPAAETELTIEVGDTLVLYTDGLIETRDAMFDDNLARLKAACATVERDLEAFASRLLADVGPHTPADDIAMVIIRRR